MRLFVTGISGLLGLNAALQLKDRHEVSGAFLTHPVRIEGVRIFRLDLTDEAATRELIAEVRPEVVLHTAGLTNVDACEKDPAGAERLHVEASAHVARAARAAGATMVHISTDHLSDGTKALISETAPPAPINEYARTKWRAEQAVAGICPEALIIRTNFFGWGTPVKASFSDWILGGLRQQHELPLFVDVHITPILINALVEMLERLLGRGAKGVYNVGGGERVSKYEFGVRLARTFGYSANTLRAVSVREAPLRARRPQDMSLSADKVTTFLGQRLPLLDESLSRLNALGEQAWPDALRRTMAQSSGTSAR